DYYCQSYDSSLSAFF
nr:immunoglobulin light chain junction region [Macaca mulatta]MOX69455.1 immunoglobulin light chain junction region [Macaca mulatta]MOX69587.1 immunoglobulin light chain junction region [Macaca mulatta]MOX69747.1 immunoglobulin light chain junction region [Macaca mulatta]MOX70418.1 immunoglobulin light chain junction region [Macaca mulatta]